MVRKDLDLSEFRGEPKVRVCIVGAFIETLDTLDKEKVCAALEDAQYKTSNIQAWLTKKPGGLN